MILTADHIKNTCKIGQGELTCGYLLIGLDGYRCCKGTEIENIILQRLAAGTMKAKGNNCEGTTGTVKLKDVKMGE